MGFLFNKVDRKDLRVGDHIYSWRKCKTYALHGIFVGDDEVVHFTSGSGQELGDGGSLINSFASSSIPKQNLSCPRSPGTCGVQNNNSGVMSSCLDCFLEGGPVYRFEYGVCKAVFFAQARGGTCTIAQSDPPDTVIHRAKYLYENGFGNYDLFSNNCEDFAIYCKTGFIVHRNASGRSGQVASVEGTAYFVYRLGYDHPNMLKDRPGLILIYAGLNYCYDRYKADIGVRVDKTKVPVEDLAAYLDSSTGIHIVKTKVPLEDSASYLDSSAYGTRNDKTKEPVEEASIGKKLPEEDLEKPPEVSVFLDSSIGKKLPGEDLAVYSDSSTGIRVDKAMAPVEVDVASSTGIRVDKATGIRVDKAMAPVEVDVASSTGIRIDKAMAPVEVDAAVSLDSSTGKKPPVTESSTSQAKSRNRSSKKKKKKQRQQRRRNCEF